VCVPGSGVNKQWPEYNGRRTPGARPNPIVSGRDTQDGCIA
jgi:hypothetical protein